VTPLASIFGSGFLIIVPVLEAAMGRWAIAGTAAVCALAWLIGNAIRHNIATIEPLVEQGRLSRGLHTLERLSDSTIVVAYVISVTLYVRIMASLLMDELGVAGETRERIVTTAVIGAIGAVGVSRGFGALELVERWALGLTLAMGGVLSAAFLVHDLLDAGRGDLQLPPAISHSAGSTLALLGGIVISVQGFETVRYLGRVYDAPTRIAASRWSQIAATFVYLTFVAFATPAMGLASGASPDSNLLELVKRVVPLFAIPLVLIATLSQLAAATADTAAAAGNLLSFGAISHHLRRGAYAVCAVGAMAMAWTAPLLTIVAIASRAFAAYYALQAAVAAWSSPHLRGRAGYALLALLLVLVVLFARPVG